MHPKHRWSITLVLILFHPLVASAELYKWYDEEGNMHVTDKPPPASVRERVEQLGRPAQDEGRAYGRDAGSYTGEEPSRQIFLERVAIQLEGSDTRLRIGKKCGRSVLVYDPAAWNRNVDWQGGFHSLLEELGYQTPTGQRVKFAHEAQKAPDLSVIGIVHDLDLLSCSRVSRIAVRWRIFDNLLRRTVHETETTGSDPGSRSEDRSADPRRSLLRAFVDSTRELLSDRDFQKLAASRGGSPASPPADADEYESLQLRMVYGTDRTSFSEQVAALKAGSSTVRTTSGHGSGFLLSRAGHVLTNAHVVAGYERVIVILGDHEIPGRVVRRDPVRDVALVQIEGAAGSAPLALAVTEPREGETIFVMGTPLSEDLHHTVTKGIVSAVRELDHQRFYQTDATVNSGNSGGPVFNERGEVVAIAVSGLTTRQGTSLGINLLIPIDEALAALEVEPRY